MPYSFTDDNEFPLDGGQWKIVSRELLGLRVGHKIQVLIYEGRMELIPVRPIRQARGFLKGIDTNVKREVDRL